MRLLAAQLTVQGMLTCSVMQSKQSRVAALSYASLHMACKATAGCCNMHATCLTHACNTSKSACWWPWEDKHVTARGEMQQIYHWGPGHPCLLLSSLAGNQSLAHSLCHTHTHVVALANSCQTVINAAGKRCHTMLHSQAVWMLNVSAVDCTA